MSHSSKVRGLFCLLLLLLLPVAWVGLAQAPVLAARIQAPSATLASEATWSVTLGEPGVRERGASVAPGENGTILVAGSASNIADDEFSLQLLKMSAGGEIVWQRRHTSGNSLTSFTTLIATDDGHYIAGGYESGQAILVKLDGDGAMVWKKQYGPAIFADVKEAAGGTLIAVGTWNIGLGEAYVVKLKADGTPLWSRLYGSPNSDAATAVLPTADGGSLVLGLHGVSGSWVWKLDGSGDVMWQKSVHNFSTTFVSAVEHNGGYLLAGSTEINGMPGVWLGQLDGNGELTWQQAYGSDAGMDWLRSFRPTDDGGYLLSGIRELPSSDEMETAGWYTKLDGNFDVVWHRTYRVPGASITLPRAGTSTTTDGHYVSVGHISYDQDEGDAWVLNFDDDGEVLRCPPLQPGVLAVYTGSVTIYDATGVASAPSPTVANANLQFQPSALSRQGSCPLPHLMVAKAGPTHTVATDPISYTLTVTNYHDSPLTGVVITDRLPTGTHYVSGGLLVGDEVRWEVPTLAAGTSLVRRFSIAATTDVVNDDYRVSCSEGYSYTGQIPIVTTVENFTYLPALQQHFCGDFFDDFSNPESGWPTGASPPIRYEYLDGEYRLLTQEAGYIFLFRSPSCERLYYETEVDARWAGATGSSYGLLFGITGDYDSYYLFDMNSDLQMYRLLHSTPSGVTTVVAPASSNAIHPGTASNHLKATVTEAGVTLEINGIVLGSWTLPAPIPWSNAGIAVIPYDDVPVVDARFDNFAMRTLAGRMAETVGFGAPGRAGTARQMPILTPE